MSNTFALSFPEARCRSNLLILAVCVLFVSVGQTKTMAAEIPFDPSRLELSVLATDLQRPMELAVANDGRVFYIELDGRLKVYDPKSQQVTLVGELKVTTAQENGLIGLALDPNFDANQWIYLQYSPPDFPGQHISRFTMKDGKLDMDSEKLLFKFEEQRKECCHHAGAMTFGPRGELFIGTGDNTHPGGDSGGYAPIDERPDRAPFDAQKSAANSKSGAGKILRIKPTPEGTYEIPEGNLFPRDGSQGLPEIYVMGCRNPWRISVDSKTGFVYWGEVGPDAGGDGPRGPRGYDEINQARSAGNFGWPYFIANNQAYAQYDYATGKVGEKFHVEKPINTSPNNTGARELPPAQPALLYYPYGASAEFPELGQGGRTACAGPVYHFDESSASPTKFPQAFDNVLFIYEWTRHWIKAVHLDGNGKVVKIEPFMPQQKFVRPIDMQFGSDGSLYLIEYGESWGVNKDARLVRIDYMAGNRRPVAKASADNAIGRAPLEVIFSSEGTFDKDSGDQLKYEWKAIRAGSENAVPQIISTEPSPKFTFKEQGVYNVELTVTDTHGGRGAATVPVLVGNAPPAISFISPRDGDFYDPSQPIPFKVEVRDYEDGTSNEDEAAEGDVDFIDADAPSRVSINAAVLAAGAAVAEPAGMRMMKGSDCFNCHAIDQKRVGPPLVDIATKYRSQNGAIDASIKRVLEGSTGVWGKIPMIPHSQHTADEVREMVSWVYSLEPTGGLRVFQGFVGEIPVEEEKNRTNGHMTLEATYIDRGADGIPALTNTAKVVLRNRLVDAELADEIHGPTVLGSGSAHGQKFLGSINHGHFARFNHVPLDRVKDVTLRVSSAGAGGQIEIRADKPDGPKLAAVDVKVNGQWEAWYDIATPLKGATGERDLFVVFVNPARQHALMNLDSILFSLK